MKEDKMWIVTVFIITFILSILFTTVSNIMEAHCNNIVLFIIMVVFIVIGIIFDGIGTSCITANEATFHSMNSRKVRGAKETITLIKNSSKISSICNDVVGDVCGIVSGGIGAVLAISISTSTGLNNVLISVLLSAFISAFTVGGKAIMKNMILKGNNADNFLFVFGKLNAMFSSKKHK